MERWQETTPGARGPVGSWEALSSGEKGAKDSLKEKTPLITILFQGYPSPDKFPSTACWSAKDKTWNQTVF